MLALADDYESRLEQARYRRMSSLSPTTTTGFRSSTLIGDLSACLVRSPNSATERSAKRTVAAEPAVWVCRPAVDVG